MAILSQRDLNDVRTRLTVWLQRHLPGATDLSVSELVVPQGTGMSSETMLFDATWRVGDVQHGGPYVARLAPEMNDWPIFPSYDLALQARVMRLVREHTNVPVPDVPWIELDASVVGSPFLVMERVGGVAPSDNPPYVFGGWLADGTTEQRRTLQDEAVRSLAKIHAIDISAHDVTFLNRLQFGDTPLTQHLNELRAYFRWAAGDDSYPLVERVAAWLEENRPTSVGPVVISWGDSRIGNMLFIDFRPTAVLDWEMACLGHAEIDLGWMAFMHRMFQLYAEVFELPGMPDFMRTTDMVATYEAASGRQLNALRFYEVLAGYRMACIFLRTSPLSIKAGMMAEPATKEGYVTFSVLLEQMLDGSYWQ